MKPPSRSTLRYLRRFSKSCRDLSYCPSRSEVERLRTMEQASVVFMIYAVSGVGRAFEEAEWNPWLVAVWGSCVAFAIWAYWRSSSGINAFLTTAVRNVEELEKALEKPEAKDEARAA